MTDQPEPAESEQRELSWAEVYSTGACGDCGNADCARCATKFLQFLRTEGASRAAQARGLG